MKNEMNSPTNGDLDNMTRDELIEEVKNLRRTFKSLQPKGIRNNSEATLWGLPLLSIAVGPDAEKGEVRGHAKGIVAIGDIATGIFAIGGFARGIFALGGCAVGLFALGGCAISIIAAVGGAAIGGIAIGGCAVGVVAVGGSAIGYYYW